MAALDLVGELAEAGDDPGRGGAAIGLRERGDERDRPDVERLLEVVLVRPECSDLVEPRRGLALAEPPPDDVRRLVGRSQDLDRSLICRSWRGVHGERIGPIADRRPEKTVDRRSDRRRDPLSHYPRGMHGLILGLIIAAGAAPGGPRLLDQDGAWCWFQDERAIVVDDTLLVGTVSGGARDSARAGDINVLVHDLGTATTTVVELHDRLEKDDHNNPALLLRRDGRVLAVYTKHGTDQLIRYRITKTPGDYTHWGPEQQVSVAGRDRHGATYSNVYRLGDRVYDFFRGAGWDPNVLVSDDEGDTWRHAGRLIGGPGRPYVRYAAGDEAIHFVCTDQHPRDFDNSLYHGFLADERVHRSDGTAVGAPGETPVEHGTLTRIFAGDADNVAWCSNIELDGAGRPAVVYSVQTCSAGLPVGEGGDDCRYRYARWDGARWHDHAIGFAGQRLYPREDDYTGLVALDPRDTSVAYLSTNAHPATGAPLMSAADGNRHYEIFRARTTNGGATWVFDALTRDSTVDNLRPIAAAGGAGPTVLVWLHGRYTTMYDFDQAVMALPLPHH